MAGNCQAPRAWKGEFILRTSVYNRTNIVRLSFSLPAYQLPLSNTKPNLIEENIFIKIWKITTIYLTCKVNPDSFCQIIYGFVTSRRSRTRVKTNLDSRVHSLPYTNLLFFPRLELLQLKI